MVLTFQSPEVERRSFVAKSHALFSFFLNHLIFVLSTEAEGRSVKAQNMHAAEAMATKNPSDPPLADLRKKPSSQVPLVWNQPHPSPQKQRNKLSQANKQGGNNRKTAAICQPNNKDKLSNNNHAGKPITRRYQGGRLLQDEVKNTTLTAPLQS